MKSNSNFFKKMICLMLVIFLNIYPVNDQLKNVAYSQTTKVELEEMFQKPEPLEIQQIPEKEYDALSDVIPTEADLTTLSGSQKTAVPGDTVVIRVKATDVGTGVDHVNFNIEGENGGSSSKSIYTTDEEGYYNFSFTVVELTQSGLWKPIWIVPYDKAGNKTYYFASSGVDLL